MSAVVVHVVEIALRQDDDWGICDVFAHPVVAGTVAETVASVTDAVRFHIESHGDVCSVYTTRSLGGLLRASRIEQEHAGAQSFFRHTIREAADPGPWLNPKEIH